MNRETQYICHHLKELRKGKKITQQMAAAAINRSVTYYKGLEKGTSEPTNKDVIGLANLFNVSIESIIGSYLKLDCDKKIINLTDDEQFRARVNQLSKTDMKILCEIIRIFHKNT